MRVSAADGYDRWAHSYDSDPNALLALEKRVLTTLLDGLRPARMIDVGCGTGRWMLHFEQIGTRVIGVDASAQMLAVAHKHDALSGKLILGDGEHLPVREGTADLVLCSMALGYFRCLHAAFGEFARVAARGASVVVSDLHPQALAAGWSRSFKAGGTRYEIDYYCHSLQAIACSATDAGLCTKAQHTAHFSLNEYPIFRCAGKQNSFAQACAIPALFVGMWGKPC
jgi:ubiquinone/menaquinone biosynthesis C-methylase UbiE